MIDKLAAIYSRYEQLEEQLGNPDLVSDLSRYKKLNKEYKDLKPLIECYQVYLEITGNINTAQEMLKDSDADMRQMAHEELSVLLPQKEEMEEKIKILLIPKDPADSKNVILEIRSGTGGDEAAIFVSDLLRMYTRYMENKGWKTEVLDVNEGVLGGYSKVVLEIQGDEVYGHLKFESGAHRVQRVPKTESQGRVHTSAATVAIIPVWEDEEININRADLKIDTYRASGAGGQHVNKTESAIRITHLPTGIVSESQDGRSQHQNKEIAMQKLYQRILDQQTAAKQSELAAQRKSLVGSGDRSEKIRTYNYPQNRCTDHRINLTLYNLDQIMDGQIDGIIEALQVAENARILEGAENN
ncbi:MAG: peptide chain release factor 1 [Bacteroidota bacterium]